MKTNFRIVKLSKIVLVDCLLELVAEARGDQLEGVVDLFPCFVADKEFTSLLGGRNDGNFVGVLAWVDWRLKRVMEVLDTECLWHYDA